MEVVIVHIKQHLKKEGEPIIQVDHFLISDSQDGHSDIAFGSSHWNLGTFLFLKRLILLVYSCAFYRSRFGQI